MPQGNFLGHRAADGVADEMEVLEANAGDQLLGVARQVLHRVGTRVRRPLGRPVPPMVEDEHPVIAREFADLPRPILLRPPVAMHEDDGVSRVSEPLMVEAQVVDDRDLLVGHSHSIVAGGLLDTSYTTRDTPAISFMMRLDTRPSRS